MIKFYKNKSNKKNVVLWILIKMFKTLFYNVWMKIVKEIFYWQINRYFNVFYNKSYKSINHLVHNVAQIINRTYNAYVIIY